MKCEECNKIIRWNTTHGRKNKKRTFTDCKCKKEIIIEEDEI